ncbi:MAG TPA: choice-of-anchor Q domain-containing protein, partial [Thermoanaerobaculia bacterium]|nr:choice-of-anchor Q domain-containing protein [Thermoanaerobaculia bacterium]
MTVSGSTVAFNRAQVSGGGVHRQPVLFPGSFPPQSFSGSIVALNTAPESPDCHSAGSTGYNVFGIGEGCNPGPTDRSGTGAVPLDAKLAPLSGAFGPTPVHTLLPGSPALDAVASVFCEASDQVGQPRRLLSCDAGAWENLELTVEHPDCVPGGSVLCLQGGRFRVSASWKTDASLPSQDAQAVPLTDDTGNYWFFSPDNLEVMVKVLDGCAFNQHWWVFSSGLTDRSVTLRVEELATGRSWTYTTAPGKTYAPKLDTGAFDCTPGPGPGIGDESVISPAPAAVVVVTKTADTFDGICDHDCSLR